MRTISMDSKHVEIPDWVPAELKGALRAELGKDRGLRFFLALLSGKKISWPTWRHFRVGDTARIARVFEGAYAIDSRSEARMLDPLASDEGLDRVAAIGTYLKNVKAMRRNWEEPMKKAQEER